MFGCVPTLFQGSADRVLIYLTLYISECLKKLQKVFSVCDLGQTNTSPVYGGALTGDIYLLPPPPPLSLSSVLTRLMHRSRLRHWLCQVSPYLEIPAFPSMPSSANQPPGQKQVCVCVCVCVRANTRRLRVCTMCGCAHLFRPDEGLFHSAETRTRRKVGRESLWPGAQT